MKKSKSFGRCVGNEALAVFIHGWSGNARGSWASIDDVLARQQRLNRWDISAFEYSTSKRPPLTGLWLDEPDLTKVAKQLRTYLSSGRVAKYKSIALFAHSMGGLVAQRALLDDEILIQRLSHLALFGVPSAGLDKAEPLARTKAQIGDMALNSAFITALRGDWTRRFGRTVPREFSFLTVAGDMDAFVPDETSLGPFPETVQRIIPGDHSSLVKVENEYQMAAVIAIDLLSGGAAIPSAIDGARLAVEQRKFQYAVNLMLPRVTELDDASLCTLAMALDGVGRGPEALEILDRYHDEGKTTSNEALGILAGRIKRRWLTDHVDADLQRAGALYKTGLAAAELASDHEQAFYHGVNLAFLAVMSTPANSAFPSALTDMIGVVLGHCALAPESIWKTATEAEATLMLRDLEGSVALYKRAISDSNSPRDLLSTYTQAVLLADRLLGARGTTAIQRTFEGIAA